MKAGSRRVGIEFVVTKKESDEPNEFLFDLIPPTATCLKFFKLPKKF